MAVTRVYATSDAHVQWDGKAYNRTNGTTVAFGMSGGECRGYFRFDLAAWAGIDISAATLGITNAGSAGNGTRSLRQVNTEYDPETYGTPMAIYNSANGTQIATFAGGANITRTFDVLTYVNTHKGGYCDFGLTSTSTNLNDAIHSSEATTQSYRPYIDITHPDTAPPDAPTNLAVSNVTASAITLTWTKPTGATGFKVYRGTSANPTEQLGSNLGDVATFTDNTPSAGTTYYYRIKAFNGYGDSDYSNEVSATIVQITAQPSHQAVTYNAQATFSVTANGATSYQWQKQIMTNYSWSDIDGATSSSYTINNVTFDGQTSYWGYRCVCSNASSSVTSTAVRLTINSIPALSNVNNIYYEKNMNNAPAGMTITHTGNVQLTGRIEVNNPTLTWEGGGYQLTGTEGVDFRAFQSINHFDFNSSRSKSNYDTYLIPANHRLGEITDPVLHDCHFRRSFGFSPRETTFKPTMNDLNDLLVDTCEFTGGITGWVRNVKLLDCYGYLDTNFPETQAKGMLLSGHNIELDGCSFAMWAGECLWKIGSSSGWANTGIVVHDCTFDGAHEEMLGIDVPTPILNANITAINGNTLTIEEYYSNDPLGITPLTGTTKLVDNWVMINTGDGIGNYYRISAQNNADITLDLTGTFQNLTGVQVNDKLTVACALVESEWYNNTFIARRGYLDRGLGCNNCLSIHGSAYGNYFHHNDFQFPHPITAPDENYTAGTGVQNFASDYATAINETGVIIGPNFSFGAASVNAHNRYEYNTFDTYFTNIATIQTIHYDTRSPEGVSAVGATVNSIATPEFYSYGLIFQNNTYTGEQPCYVTDVQNIVFGGNSTSDPITTYEGMVGSNDDTMSPQELYPYDYEWRDWAGYGPEDAATWENYNPDWETEENWLWEYNFTLHAESNTTWAIPIEPTDLTATIDGDDVDLAWTLNAGSEGTKIYRSVDGGSYSLLDTLVGTTETYTDTTTDLVNHSYNYKVTAYNDSGESGYSNVAGTPSVQNIQADLKRIVQKQESPTADTKRIVHEMEVVIGDTKRIVYVEETVGGDTKRTVVDLQALEGDTKRTVVENETLTADTKRTLHKEEVVNADTLRVLHTLETLITDTKRVVVKGETINADTKRTVLKFETVNADAIRIVQKLEEIAADTLRIVAIWEEQTIQADTKRIVVKFETVDGDTKRDVQKEEQIAADTKRVIYNLTNAPETNVAYELIFVDGKAAINIDEDQYMRI